MHVPTLISLAFATLLPLAVARDDDPASQDNAASAAEDACYTKTLDTGSGAAAAIKGFCSQIDNSDADSDNPSSAADTSVNGYTAGGFEPSGITTTAKLAAKKDCKVSIGDEEKCLEKFWDVCQKGDKSGRGVVKDGCLEIRVE